MNKARIKSILIACIISSLFFVKGIYGYVTDTTTTEVNKFTINNKTSYTVRHELMNLDGTTYTLHQEQTYNNIVLGTEVSPEVLTFTGFDSPARQTVLINTFNRRVITYQYPRKQYTLTITNSNHVTTQTPSGTYYYGQQIHLVADSTSGGSPFVKWSNDNTNRDYTFTLTENTTIGPIYANSHTITFVPNNGDQPFTISVPENQPIGTLPTVTNNDCSSGTGSYLARNCTYVYEFKGWYKESTFVNKVTRNFTPTGDITLYAKWDKVFFSSPGSTNFDGTNYINTEIRLFNQENADKDFIVTFTVDANNGYVTERGTIFTNMNEKGEPWPGVQFFTEGKNAPYDYVMNANTQDIRYRHNDTGYNTGEKVVIKRESGLIYYSYDDGPFIQINDFTNFSAYFNDYATFGAGTKSNGTIYRYFKGTISDMSVELIDPPTYTVVFDANGGSGLMDNQSIRVGASEILDNNEFTNNDSSFGGWNTEPDGTGTSYTNREIVTNLGSAGQTVTLYAQWIPPVHYYVHFDANGGTGTMPDQQLTYNGIPVPLDTNTFIRTGYVFKGWNTQADGTGTSYTDGESVADLSDTEGDIVTLYAQYRKIAYVHNGDKVFDGTSATFVDTGVNLYDEDTVNKDFEIRFTVKNSISNNTFQATIINCKDESNNKWPGFNIRFGRQNDLTKMTPTYKWNNLNQSSTLQDISINNVPVEFVIKRTNKVVTLSYSYEGYQSTVHTLYNQEDWTLTKYFEDNVSFGGIYNSTHNPDRFFNGTLSDMIILVDE